MRFNHNRSGMKRLVAYMLILAMLLTIMPVSAFAKKAPKLRLPGVPAAAEAPAEAPEAPAEPEAPAAEEAPAEPAAPEAPPAPEEAAAPEAPAAPEEPAEPESPAIVQELKVGKLTVSIDAEPGAFPEGTKVKAKKVDLKDIQKSIDEAKDVDGEVLVAVDITFTLKGKEVQPAEGKSVKVNISAPELKDKARKAAVVHIDDETKKPELVEEVKAPETDEVSFDADSFSIYAVFEPPYDGPTARVTVNFYGYDGVENGELKYKKIQTFWVKNSDDADQIAMNVIDPGIGDLGDMKDKIIFRGWSLDKLVDAEGDPYPQDPEDTTEYVGPAYDTKFDAMSIEDVRTYLKDLEIHEGDVLNVYAVLYQFYHVTYYGDFKDESELQPGETNVSLGKQTVFRLVGHDEAPYEINMGFSTVENDRNFKGWKPIEGGDKITPPLSETKEFYENGEDVTITGDVTFVAEAPYGVWLVYHANGKGATYNAPQFYEGHDGAWPTTTPAENATADKMVRKGYNFVGWYYGKTVEGSDELVIDEDRPFTFGGDITEDTDIFAKWVEKTEAPYTVVCYIQRLDDPTKYDIADTQVFNADENLANDIHVGDDIPYTVVENNAEDYATGVGSKVVDGQTVQKGHYTGFCLRDDCKELEVPITADGEAVLELYYDRITYNFKFYLYRQEGTSEYETNHVPFTGNGVVNGGPYYGTYDDGVTYFQVYWRNRNGGQWRTENGNYSGTQYTGPVYTEVQVPVADSFVPDESGYYYANNSANGSDQDSIVNWHGNGTTHPTLSGKYSDDDLQYEDLTFGDETYRYYYFTITAKYGEDISARWPLYDEDIVGVGDRVPVSYVMMVGTALKPNPSAGGDGTVKGIITILNENILGATNDEDGNYVIVRFPTSHNEWRYHIWYEALDGKDINGVALDPDDIVDYNGRSYYQDDVVVVRSSNTQVSSQNQPKYEGFDFVGKKGQNWDAGTVNYWTTSEGGTTYYHLNYLYNRQMYVVTYNDGQYVDGNGNDLVNKASRLLSESDDIPVGADISDCESYDPSAEDEPGPSEPGFVFEGWYLDETCEHPYNFETMPLGGVRVFAKWVQIQYRVFMHPNATVKNSAGTDVDDTTLSWGDETLALDEKQAMCFRISYGDTVSTPTGTREGYLFRGWYKDPGLNQAYSSKTELNETTVKTAYNQETDMTDIMDKFGNIVENGATYYVSNLTLQADSDPYNSDANKDRWWITKKLDLYARWQKILEGAQGVSVDYDAVTGKGQFADGTTLYHDPLPYEDNSNAVAASAPTSTVDGQQFLYWVVQQWNGTAYEDAKDTDGNLIRSYPGDDIRVLASYAKIVEEGSEDPVDPSAVQSGHTYIYTMQVRAEYGPIEVPKDTYFNWYRNYTVDKDQTGETAVAAATIYQNHDLQINEAVEIYTITNGTLPTPERDGYTFKGWAREYEYANNPPAKDEDGNIIEDPILYYENPEVYLKWVEADDGAKAAAHYEAYNDKTEQWETVTEVAADEFLPYQAWYAVWEADFYTVVYMEPDGNVLSETEYDYEEGGEFNFVENMPDEHYYGGYYFAAPTADGWDADEAGTDSGRMFVPQAGKTYYVKALPKDYLQAYYKYLYIKNRYKTTDMWVATCIDDANYDEAGFLVIPVTNDGGTAGLDITAIQVYRTPDDVRLRRQITIVPGNTPASQVEANKVVITPDLVTRSDKWSGVLPFISVDKFVKFNNEDTTARPKAHFRIVPYYVTFDGETILGDVGYDLYIHKTTKPVNKSEFTLTEEQKEEYVLNYIWEDND